MFPGFPTRLVNEVTRLYKEKILKNTGEMKMAIEVSDPPRRKFNVFIGGSFLANVMQNAPQFWITKKDWDEMGVKALSKVNESLKMW